jgi:hypothetical protein
VHPVARAGPSFHAAISRGKFLANKTDEKNHTREITRKTKQQQFVLSTIKHKTEINEQTNRQSRKIIHTKKQNNHPQFVLNKSSQNK